MDLKELSTRTLEIMGYCVVMMGYYKHSVVQKDCGGRLQNEKTYSVFLSLPK